MTIVLETIISSALQSCDDEPFSSFKLLSMSNQKPKYCWFRLGPTSLGREDKMPPKEEQCYFQTEQLVGKDCCSALVEKELSLDSFISHLFT